MNSLAKLFTRSLWLAVLGGASGIAYGQGPVFERSDVLAQAGKVETATIQLGPVDAGLGVVYTTEVVRSNADSLRFRFSIARADDNWAILVRAAPGGPVVWTAWHGTPRGENTLWTDVIAGNRAVVEVLSTMPGNQVQLSIDRVVLGDDDEPVPVSIHGPNQLRSIVDAEPWMVDLGRSVARLRFVADDGNAYVCTAFLVTSDLMLTNEHCIMSESERESALVDFDYDRTDARLTGHRLRALIANDFGLDYALVRLAAPVDRRPLRLATSRPLNAHSLVIVQHPEGKPKQISLADCAVTGALVTGRGGEPTDFGHTCDTKGGSSGSPVVALDTREVVGLHHLGFEEGVPGLVNRATHVGLVLDRLPPAARNEILGSNR